jgi:hypothetical protein
MPVTGFGSGASSMYERKVLLTSGSKSWRDGGLRQLTGSTPDTASGET